QRRRLGDDDAHERAGLAAAERQPVDLREMHDHADVDERRREQVRDRHRVEGDGDALRDAPGADHAIRDLAPRFQYAPSHVVAEVCREQARVHRGERLALGLEDFPQPQPEPLDVRRARPLHRGLRSLLVDLDDRLRPRIGGHRDHVRCRHEPVRLPADGGEERLELVAGVLIGLVQRDDDPDPAARPSGFLRMAARSAPSWSLGYWWALFSATATGRPRPSNALSASRSLSVMSPSMTKITRSARPATSFASASRSSPQASSSPGVSMRNTPPASTSQGSMCEARVSPCSGLTLNRRSPMSALGSDDLPVPARPNTAMWRWPCSSFSSMARTAA